MIPDFWVAPAWAWWTMLVLAYLFLAIYVKYWINWLLVVVGVILSLPFIPGVWLVSAIEAMVNREGS